MIRNSEIRVFGILLAVISVTGSTIAFACDFSAGVVMVATCTAFVAAEFVFTWLRYARIKRLASYIDKILNGETVFDMRDNREGELSILKNEIYKVTVMLSNQSEQLAIDKNKLSEALTDISHQLKTPMTSMGVMIDLLGDEELPPDKRREFIKRLRSQTERIHWLVTSLLKIARLDAGAVDLKKEFIVVRKLIASAAEPLAIPMELKEQTLSFSGSENTAFSGDFNWMREAVVNILKNCMEHTPQGGNIEAQWEDNPLYIQLKISDTGSGISSEDLPHIFSRFYKGQNAEPGSAGIGLAMAKAVVERHNGTITAGNSARKGAVFTIRLYKGRAV